MLGSDLRIVNGYNWDRTHVGEFTSVSIVGKSTIDNAIASQYFLSISRFIVHDLLTFSLHTHTPV